MKTALVLAAFLGFLVALSYLFAVSERRTVIAECFERAISTDQASVCRALHRGPLR